MQRENNVKSEMASGVVYAFGDGFREKVNRDYPRVDSRLPFWSVLFFTFNLVILSFERKKVQRKKIPTTDHVHFFIHTPLSASVLSNPCDSDSVTLSHVLLMSAT